MKKENNELLEYFHTASRTALVPTGAKIEEPLVLTDGTVTVPLRLELGGEERTAPATVRVVHVRTLGRFQLHFK